MAYTLKRLLVGKAKKTAAAMHERLTKKTGLAVFASDALSSTAYATEEILLVLAVAYAAQANSFNYVVPITFGIVIVLTIVAISYRQTIFAYPSGGGAYIVAKENLGTMPGLVAGAALLVDYVLTVAVSIAAGVAAITSAAQGTSLAWVADHKIIFCLVLIGLIALANLRGVRESGSLFAGPTYLFVFSFLFMLGYGLISYYLNPGTTVPPAEDLKFAEGYDLQPLTWFLLLGAFSNGSVALSGTEAISNGIPAFRQPESRNAATTLGWMAALLATMFIGTSVMSYLYHVQPRQSETVISQFARTIFTGPMGWFYYVIQGATALILVLAANTAFADFPRLSSLLARDRFLPRQFATRGDKLVFSNGIIMLAIFSGVLVAAFGGDTSRLIPLYAVGVFLSFTLSQSGMVLHWWKAGRKATQPPEPELVNTKTNTDEQKLARHWKKSIAINGIGAIATCVVLIVLVMTKFTHGAWIVVVIIPLLVALFRAIHRHYMDVATQLTTAGLQKVRPVEHEVIVPISGIHRGVLQALDYAKTIASGGHITALYINLDEAATQKLRTKWSGFVEGVELVVIASPYRSLVGPLVRYIDRRLKLHPQKLVTVVLPEFVPAKWWHNLLHNQTSLMLKGALLFKPNVIVISVPYHLRADNGGDGK
ncbi:MAG TPA: APC family permease [Pyrinomonadaceae bacterium]